MRPVPSSTSVLKPVCGNATRRNEYQPEVSSWYPRVVRRLVVALQEVGRHDASLHSGLWGAYITSGCLKRTSVFVNQASESLPADHPTSAYGQLGTCRWHQP
jgi:hypothetical protein